jgi:hypothetical protein
VEANSTGGQGSRRAVAPSDDDDELHSTIYKSYPALCSLGFVYLFFRKTSQVPAPFDKPLLV